MKREKCHLAFFFQQNWAIHLLMDLAQEYDYVKISQSIDLTEDDIIK